jgi:hypothetical protein
VTFTFELGECHIFQSDTGRAYLHRSGDGELFPAGDCPAESEALATAPRGPCRVVVTVIPVGATP